MRRGQRRSGVVELPKGVQRVVSRGREYFYYQAGRGTTAEGPRVALPKDPTSPTFWTKLREAQGEDFSGADRTVRAAVDAYKTSDEFRGLSAGTQDQYARALKLAIAAWGDLPATGVRPAAVQKLMAGLHAMPGKANTFLGTMRAFSSWLRVQDWIDASMTEGVKPYPKDGGHKPWTEDQIACAEKHLTGMVRRLVMLGLYTGQRGSDLVRLGWTDIDEGGFRLTQAKTGREVWCPILPQLAVEMATWEKAPGPFLRSSKRARWTRKLAWQAWDRERAERPELAPLADATLHGLRCTAVIRLRRGGLASGQIGDIVGMSIPMIDRYCRFADKKASGKAALLRLEQVRNAELENNCKTIGRTPKKL